MTKGSFSWAWRYAFDVRMGRALVELNRLLRASSHPMKNPWNNLPESAPYVLGADEEKIAAFNDRHFGEPDLRIQTHLLPEPFFGDLDAPVYALCLNPGYSPEDDSWHKKAAFTSAVIARRRACKCGADRQDRVVPVEWFHNRYTSVVARAHAR